MSSGEDVARLRDCLDDLVTVTALPGLRADGDPHHVVSTLLDALLGTLRLAFVVVRLNDADGGPSLEMTRVAEPLEGTRADVSLATTRLGRP